MKETSAKLQDLRIKEAALDIKVKTSNEVPVFYIKDNYEVCKELIVAKKISNKRLVIKNEAGLFLLIIFKFDEDDDKVYPSLINISNVKHKKALNYLLESSELHLDIINERNEYIGTDIIENQAVPIIEKYLELTLNIYNKEDMFNVYRCYLMEEKNLIKEYLYS